MNDELLETSFLQYSDLGRVAGVCASSRRLFAAISTPLILLSADVIPPALSVRCLVEASDAGYGCAPDRRRGEAKEKGIRR